MRLEDVINMNQKLVPKPSVIATICICVLTIICVDFIHITIAWLGILVALMLSFVSLTVIPMNHIFSKSVFGEYAYQYMSIPISFMDLVKGKVITAFMYCTISVLIAVIYYDYFMIHFFNSGGAAYGDIVDMSIIAFINMHEVMSENIIFTESIIFIFGTIYIGVMIESLFISAGVFYAIIIRNIIEPQREKIAVAIGIGLVAVIVYIVFSFLCVRIPGLLFENDLAIPQLIIAAILKVGGAYGFMIYSAKLLEKKYSLN